MGACMGLSVCLWMATLLPQAAPGLTRDEALQRWQQMSEEERGEMKRRLRVFQGMSREEKLELESRLQSLRQSAQRAQQDMPVELRSRFDHLQPREREVIERELIEQELVQRGRDVLDRLPARLRERLAELSGPERVRAIRELKREFRGRKLDRALETLGNDLQLDREEMDRIRTLPAEARGQKFLELHQQRLLKQAEAGSPPGSIRREEWPEWRTLSPEEFHLRLLARRSRGGEASVREGGSLPRFLGRPEADWRIELARLRPEERRDEIERRLRQRVLQYLEEHPEALSAGEREALRSAEGRPFAEALRNHFRSPSPSRR